MCLLAALCVHGASSTWVTHHVLIPATKGPGLGCVWGADACSRPCLWPSNLPHNITAPRLDLEGPHLPSACCMQDVQDMARMFWRFATQPFTRYILLRDSILDGAADATERWAYGSMPWRNGDPNNTTLKVRG